MEGKCHCLSLSSLHSSWSTWWFEMGEKPSTTSTRKYQTLLNWRQPSATNVARTIAVATGYRMKNYCVMWRVWFLLHRFSRWLQRKSSGTRTGWKMQQSSNTLSSYTPFCNLFVCTVCIGLQKFHIMFIGHMEFGVNLPDVEDRQPKNMPKPYGHLGRCVLW